MIDLGGYKPANVKNDVLSGLTVALALVPEAVAFAFVAGVEPLVGLYAAFMVGLITAVFGGRPGMISGATGALAVVMVTLVAEHGVEYLFATVVLMGILQVLAGWLRLGKFIRMVPHPVMLGFVNGLAIVIFLAQLGQFGIVGEPGWLAETRFAGSVIDVAQLGQFGIVGEPGWLAETRFAGSVIDVAWIGGSDLYLMLALIALTMAIIKFLPLVTTAVPSSLVAIVVVSLLVIGFGMDTRTVGDVASIKGGLPSLHIPAVPLNLHTLSIIFPYAVVLAAIGLIESLLTLRLIDEVTETRGRGNRECTGQGLANIVTGLFGGMGGCAMIGQSMININSGGRGRLSGITAALALLCFILFASPLIEMIPIAALVGVMFIVVIGTFEWSSLRIMNKVPKMDAFIIVLVSAVTVVTDLAVAVVVGVIVSALAFAWEHAKQVHVVKLSGRKHSTLYRVHGPLFFASTASFLQQFKPAEDLDDVVIDFAHSRVMDHSGIAALDTLAERYSAAGKTLHLIHLSEDCRKLLTKAGDLVEVNMVSDPKYFVADDAVA